MLYHDFLLLDAVGNPKESAVNVLGLLTCRGSAVRLQLDCAFIVLIEEHFLFFDVEALSFQEIARPQHAGQVVTGAYHFGLRTAFGVELLLLRLATKSSPAKGHGASGMATLIGMRAIRGVDPSSEYSNNAIYPQDELEVTRPMQVSKDVTQLFPIFLRGVQDVHKNATGKRMSIWALCEVNKSLAVMLWKMSARSLSSAHAVLFVVIDDGERLHEEAATAHPRFCEGERKEFENEGIPGNHRRSFQRMQFHSALCLSLP